MEERLTKAQFIALIREKREEWERLAAKVDEAAVLQPGASGEWTLKDVIAHISWHEREMSGVIKAHALVGSDLWNLPTDQRNAIIYEENKGRSLEEVRAEAEASFAELLIWLETLTDEDLYDASRFPNMPLEWKPIDVIASNTNEHYEEHSRYLEAMLKS